MDARADVVVVGAGPAGSCVAYWLARGGLSVALLDRAVFPRDKTCGDGLAPRSIAALARMGVLGELATSPRCEIGRAFGPGGVRIETPMGPRDSAYPRYSLVVRRVVLDDVLRRRAEAAGASFTGGFHVEALWPEDGGVAATGRCRGAIATVRARVAVLAVGASLPLVEAAGLLRRRPRLMRAARAYYEGRPGDDGAVEFFFDGVRSPGYGWIFPLGTGIANVGAGFFPAEGDRTTGPAALEEFLRACPAARERLGGARRASAVAGYPLRTDFAGARTTGDAVIAIGEAVGLVHPLTGEGIDFALETGELAAQFLAEALRGGDLGARRLAGFDRLLRARYQTLFRFARLLRRLYMRPAGIRFVMERAARKPEVAEALGGIMTATASPLAAFDPRLLFR